MNNYKVLALATCFNRCEKTKKSLYTLQEKNSDIDFDFIICDDNSNDGTYEMLEKIENVTVLKGNGNLFYSGGMRKAISKAKSMDLTKYDYIMFMNDDVEFFENSISKLIIELNSQNSIIIGSMCDDNNQLSYGGAIKTSKIRPNTKNVMSTSDNIVYCDTFCANCVLIPKNIFVKLDNIDSVYTHAMGDFDYGFTAVRNGYKIIASSFFVGKCNDNPVENTWKNVNLTRKERIKRKESPKGLPYKEWFHYLNKNYNILTAIIYSLTPYIRILLKK